MNRITSILSILLATVLTGCGGLSPANVEGNSEQLRRYIATNDLPDTRKEALEDRRVVEGMTEEEVYLVVAADPLFNPEPLEIDTLQTGHQIRIYDTPTSDYGPMRVQFNDSLRVVSVQDPTQ